MIKDFYLCERKLQLGFSLYLKILEDRLIKILKFGKKCLIKWLILKFLLLPTLSADH